LPETGEASYHARRVDFDARTDRKERNVNPATVETESPMRPLNVRRDHGCFGCGRLNPHGLRLEFFRTDDGQAVWTPFTPALEHEGYAGVVHGGIVSAVLDEVMAWALYARGLWAVTGKIEVRFRRPLEVGVSTRAVGRLVADRGRVLTTTGELRSLSRQADGQLLAEATATFVRVPEEQAAAWRERYLGEPREALADGASG
jgi:acyl-coenzyme A thioesterase PaaI-like protein